MKKLFIRLTSILLIMLLICSYLTSAYGFVSAAENNDNQAVLPDNYSNILRNYSPETYGECRTSFLQKRSNGDYQVVCYSDKLYVMTYSSEFVFKSIKSLDLELPKWGGAYLGESFNYVVCGQDRNSEEENGGEVYRIIKYDKDFNRLDSLSLNSDETYTSTPFRSGNVSMDEFNSELNVYTSRLRLDGHQSNLSLRINTNDMSIVNSYELAAFPSIHVSHSFRQIVKYDGANPVYLDLCDAYPERSVYLQSNNGSGSLMNIDGEYGDNRTYAEVSGLEISNTNYLAVGSYLNNLMNNVFISSFDKSSGNVETQWLTKSSPYSPEAVGNPRIVKIDKGKFLVMWMSGTNIDYVLIDGYGNTISSLKTLKFTELSDCEPIYDSGKVVWVNVNNGIVRFSQIDDLSGSGTYKAEFDYKESETAWDGTSDTSWFDDSKNEFNLSSPEQLAGLSKLVNDGNTFNGKTVNLMNDIYLNRKSPITTLEYNNEWIPIAEEKVNTDIYFDGTFNGNNHHIYNMYVSNSYYGGLFGVIGENGIVKAVNNSQGYCNSNGAIASFNRGIIMFCNNRSVIDGFGTNSSWSTDAGGICNRNDNLVYGCKNYGTVYGGGVGGIVGMNSNGGTVNSCGNFGWVQASKNAGGIVNYNYGWLYNCYNKGVLSNAGEGINYGRFLGGIVHFNNSHPAKNIENCYFAGIFDTIYLSPSPIGADEASNCYYLSDEDKNNSGIPLTYKEMTDPSFIEKINGSQPQWMQDTIGINDGLPITIADYNAYKGVYKMPPEIWINYSKNPDNLDLRDGTFTMSFSLYYCEEAPTVSLDNPDIADLTYTTDNKGGTVTLNLKKTGSTNIKLKFNETENNCETVFDYKVTIIGNIVFGDVNSDNTVNAKDRMLFTRYLAKWSGYEDIDMTAADVNSDGGVNAKDRMILTRHLAKWQGYESLPYTK